MNFFFQVLEDFKYSISALKIPRISIQKDSFDMIYGSEKSNIIANTYNSQTNCCILLDKPLEKILIRYQSMINIFQDWIESMMSDDIFKFLLLFHRYEQMPKEFKTVVFPDGTQPSPKAASQLSSSHGLITTLSRYLHHRRWIWKTSIESSIFLPSSFLATIMSTLVKYDFLILMFENCILHQINVVLPLQDSFTGRILFCSLQPRNL